MNDSTGKDQANTVGISPRALVGEMGAGAAGLSPGMVGLLAARGGDDNGRDRGLPRAGPGSPSRSGPRRASTGW